MRQPLIQVPQGRGKEVARIGQQNQATNMAQWQVTKNDQPQDLIMMHIANRRVERVLKALEDMSEMRISMSGHETMTLHLPSSETPNQHDRVQPHRYLPSTKNCQPNARAVSGVPSGGDGVYGALVGNLRPTEETHRAARLPWSWNEMCGSQRWLAR